MEQTDLFGRSIRGGARAAAGLPLPRRPHHGGGRGASSRLPAPPFKELQFRGKRRVVSFGWRYDCEGITQTDPVAAFLPPLAQQVACFAGSTSEALEQVLVSEYPPGAPIGWHKDRPVFGNVVGISLLALCTFRLRRGMASGWQRAALLLEPRSAYLLSGPARSLWERSIPPVERLRYSITFRSMQRRHGT
jgi:alkylated DNA repair dioxygenase AlkB